MKSVQRTLTAAPLHLTRDEIWTGFKQLIPLSFFIIIFGAAFSLAASQKGLDNSSILFMSATVFAGASQFGALDLWGAQVPLIPLMLTLAIRVGGMIFMSYAALGTRTREFMQAMSGSVPVAVIVPVAINADGAARTGLLVTGIVVLLTQKLLPAISAGISTVILGRHLL